MVNKSFFLGGGGLKKDSAGIFDINLSVMGLSFIMQGTIKNKKVTKQYDIISVYSDSIYIHIYDTACQIIFQYIRLTIFAQALIDTNIDKRMRYIQRKKDLQKICGPATKALTPPPSSLVDTLFGEFF